jgi:hypothetical protein
MGEFVYKGVNVIKHPNGLYHGKFFIKDFEYECHVTAWSKEEFIDKFEAFILEYGELEEK